MGTLEQLLAEIVATRDTPAARRLALECYLVGRRSGEAEGVAWARVVLDGCRRLNAADREHRGAETTAPGAVLGTKEPPAGGCWWLGWVGMKTKTRPEMAWSEDRPVWAVYWAADGTGWWRVPAA